MEAPGQECAAVAQTGWAPFIRWDAVGHSPHTLTVVRTPCHECDGSGVILSLAWIVQRCDSCQVFEDDIQAAYGVTDMPTKLVCGFCGHWEMSVTEASIPCANCAGVLAARQADKEVLASES